MEGIAVYRGFEESLTRVIQGSNEPYADFVDRLMQTAFKLFQDVEAAMPLVNQLAYEQAHKWCRDVISPWKTKLLETCIMICRDVRETVISEVMTTPWL